MQAVYLCSIGQEFPGISLESFQDQSYGIVPVSEDSLFEYLADNSLFTTDLSFAFM